MALVIIFYQLKLHMSQSFKNYLCYTLCFEFNRFVHTNLPLQENYILKGSNYCFDSLAIRQRSKDLKHLIPRDGLSGLQG